MSNVIHSSAIIEDGAQIGEDNVICENVIIRKSTILGNGNFIGPNSLIENKVNIGNNNKFYGFISVGTLGEMGTKGDTLPSGGIVEIGNHNIFREFITINFPVKNKKTSIMNNCYFMSRTHIPHDAKIGNYVVMATNSLIGGGCILDDFVYIGLNAHIHQWLHIGEGSILGMSSGTVKNVPPFLTVVGIPSKAIKVNEEGLKRRQFSIETINTFKGFLLGSSDNNELIKKYKLFTNKYDNCLKI